MTSKPKDFAGLVSEALALLGGGVKDIADSSGISREAMYSWASGRRTPRPENAARLAAALRERGEALREIAGALENAAGNP